MLLIKSHVTKSEGAHYKCKSAILFAGLNWSAQTPCNFNEQTGFLFPQVSRLLFKSLRSHEVPRSRSSCAVAPLESSNNRSRGFFFSFSLSVGRTPNMFIVCAISRGGKKETESVQRYLAANEMHAPVLHCERRSRGRRISWQMHRQRASITDI